MRRQYSFLLGALLCTLTLPPAILGQTIPSSAVEVAYVLTSPGIAVYDVDRSTGTPTFEGLAAVPLKFISVVPSPDDHFVYVYGSDTIFGQQSFYVYETDSAGMLQQPAVQKFDLPAPMGNFIIHPRGRFAYGVVGKGSNGAGILLFTLDPKTGRVTGAPEMVATYPPNGPCGTGWSITGTLLLVGFNPGADRMYDEWFCASHDTLSYYFYTRRIDTHTGKLGPDVQTLSAGGSNGSYSDVSFTPKVIIDDYVSADYSENTVYVFPLTGGTVPLFTCAAAMLEACSQGDYTVEPSGEYIFFSTNSGNDEITKLDLQAKTIVDTGNSMPGGIRAFSGDSALIYTSQSYMSPWIFPIYTFDLATGVATEGGQIVVENSPFVSVVPAIRR